MRNVSGKTKDNDNSRKYLALYCGRKDLELILQANGRLLKQRENYTLIKEDTIVVCRWMEELRIPVGYSSNLGICADIEKSSIQGIKSHGCHVFMETLLPIVLRYLLMHVLIF